MQTVKGKTIPNRNRLTAAKKKEKLKEELYQYYQARLKASKEGEGPDTTFGRLEMPPRGKFKKMEVTSPGQRRDKDYGFKVQKRNKKFMTKK